MSADTTGVVFAERAARLADDIRHETALAVEAYDPVWLRDVCRAATAAVDIVRDARAEAEAAYTAGRVAS